MELMEVKKQYSNCEKTFKAYNKSVSTNMPTFKILRDKYDLTKELANTSDIELDYPNGDRSSQVIYHKMDIQPDPKPDENAVTSTTHQGKQKDKPIVIANYTQKLNSQLLDAVENNNIEEIVRLLGNGANPNATCRLSHVSACHVAALRGGEALPLLLRAGATPKRYDNFGRTPLHLAAWAGNAKEIAILLDFPKDLQARAIDENMSSETEEEIKLLAQAVAPVNVVIDNGVINLVPKTWMDDITHACKDINERIPNLNSKWTPLHAASFHACAHCVRLLLAAGADPDAKDLEGHIPLEVAGCAVYSSHRIDIEEFTKTIKLLVKVLGRNNEPLQDVLNRPLHTAVELKSLEAIKILLNQSSDQSRKGILIDCKDNEGLTVLHAAVRSGWTPGIRIALEAGVDITIMALNGETALHDAAASGNIEILTELVDAAKTTNVIDYLNDKKETALLTAVKEGHLDCVKLLLKEGASIKQKLPGNVNILHIASDKGHIDVLRYLVDSQFTMTHKMINSTNENRRYGDTPLQCAVMNNHSECVKFLLSKNADVRYDSKKGFLSSPLHIAVMNNNSKIANMILDFDKTTLYLVNCLGWTPLHTACRYASRECIRVLLQRGADMSRPTVVLKTETAFSMIMHNLSQPTEFVEDIFDSCIKYRTEPIEKASVIDIDYSILAPHDGEKKQMKVINTLRSSGNRYNQKTLLLHPLVKSFLYLKWKALLPFFYTIFLLYSLFVISLSTLIMSVFTYKNGQAPIWMNSTVWTYIVVVAMFFVIILEIIYSMNIKSKTYFLHIEFWTRFSSIILGIVVVIALVVARSDAEWIRHLATMAMLVSWLEMMFLLSRFPKWGYYFLMFGTVAFKMLKILLTFTFLLIGFTLAFMLQFHSERPFDNFWSSIVKTMVMMISEFNYDGLFKEPNSKELAVIMLQLIFLVFIIATAVVLMNLMVGVAVNDVHNLEVIGNIKRIVKQIDLLGSLESLVYSNIFHRILPKYLNRSLQDRREIRKQVTLQLGNSFSENILPYHIIDAIFDKAYAIKKRTEDEVDNEVFKTQINEIYKSIVLNNVKSLDVPCTEENMKPKMRTKIKEMDMKIDSIERTLFRIEKHISDKRLC